MAHQKSFFNLSRSQKFRALFLALPAAAALFGVTAARAANREPFVKQTFVYKTVNGCGLRADFYPAPGNAVRPLIFWIHGGALMMGHRGNLERDHLERYIRAGFSVLSIDYRLAPETKLPGILDDVQDAYHWARSMAPKLRIDPDRIAVVGHSAGGYLALASGYLFHPRPRAIVSFYGYGDIAGAWYSEPSPFYSRKAMVSRADALKAISGGVPCGGKNPPQRFLFYLYCRQQGLWPKEVTGLDPHTNPRAFDRFCPIRNVQSDYPPTMLLHGDKDTDVPFEQSVGMYDELKRHHIECEFIPVAGGGHGFDSRKMNDPEISADFDRVIAFLKRHLD
ncbi:MAG TPA: alpha/beta hydrolase [Terriglobia bacterium]|nr:alpha/beta hydrolase [Terriglobia bacterium]